MRTLESAVLREARQVLKNKKLRLEDILEWSTGAVVAPDETEVVVWLPELRANVCVSKEHDKR